MEENHSSSEQSPLTTDGRSPSIVSIHSDHELTLLEKTNLDRLTDFSNLLPPTPNTLMTIEDLQRVETIQNAYEKRIELGKYLALALDKNRTILPLLSLKFSCARRSAMESI